MAKEQVGQWSDPFPLSNVPVHVTLLPNGKVLHWGRRDNPKATEPNSPSTVNMASLDENFTKSFVWDPSPWDPKNGKFGKSQPTGNQPLGQDGKTVNLFCSGHCILPDGKVLVTGGHIKDGLGVNQACTYDPKTDQWTPQPLMNKGRWYPSTLTLPDGRALCISGSDNQNFAPNTIPQIWTADNPTPNTWIEVADPVPSGLMLDLFPRLHITPTGRIFMAGPKPDAWFLDIKDAKGNDITNAVAAGDKNAPKPVGSWTRADTARQGGFRDYAPSVMYDSGKVMYIGGGTGDDGPSNIVEFIDLNAQAPKWTSSDTTNLKTARKQFNATILPDGTVFVTGGTKGPGFNNLDKTNTVHTAELYDPLAPNNGWVVMASESRDRCYHSTALLLPDGRVLSGGGGEYGGCTPDDCLPDAQIFEPPYMFKSRPTLSGVQSEIKYAEQFTVTVGANDVIDKISLLRLGSVTHCRNMNQSLIFLERVKQDSSKVTVRAPANANLAPPGHYLLFVLNKDRVPSVGSILHIPMPSVSAQAPTPPRHVANGTHRAAPSTQVQPSLLDHNERVIADETRSHVVVGLTPVCPYGLGPCWGGAYDALQRVTDIDVVRPVPHQADSVAFVYMHKDKLPDIEEWRREFEEVANKGYAMRGLEMTISGHVSKKQSDAGEQLVLIHAPTESQVTLAPFRETSQVKWDIKAKAPHPVTDLETKAYEKLLADITKDPTETTVQVTGTLHKDSDNKFTLDVRDYKVL